MSIVEEVTASLDGYPLMLTVEEASRVLRIGRSLERRRQLAATEQALGAATSNLERIEATAGGLRDLYNDLRSRHEAARRRVMHQEILDQWGNHESRAEQLDVRVVAETVRRWASRGGTELAHPSATWRARPVGPRRHGLDLGLGR